MPSSVFHQQLSHATTLGSAFAHPPVSLLSWHGHRICSARLLTTRLEALTCRSSVRSNPCRRSARGSWHVPSLSILSVTAVAVALVPRFRRGRTVCCTTHAVEPGTCLEDLEEMPLSQLDDLPEIFPSAVIVGGGRMGRAIFAMGDGWDVLVGRLDPFPEDAPVGPIYMCTKNDDLKAAIAKVPTKRHEDMVFVQEGDLGPLLVEELAPGLPVTQVLFWGSRSRNPVASVRTEFDLKGINCVGAHGKWAEEVNVRMMTNRVGGQLRPEPGFTQCYWERNIWLAAYMLVGVLHGGCSVGTVVRELRQEVDALMMELATAVSAAHPHVLWDRGQICERLARFSERIPNRPSVLEDFKWRNGIFYEISLQAAAAGRPDPCPRHTEALLRIGAIPRPQLEEEHSASAASRPPSGTDTKHSAIAASRPPRGTNTKHSAIAASPPPSGTDTTGGSADVKSLLLTSTKRKK